MKHLLITITGCAVMAGCGVGPAFEDTRPMRNTNDMQQQTIAGATCTRGEKPFTLIVDRDGTATGRLIAPPPPKGEKRRIMPEFAAALTPIDRDTVELVVADGIVTGEAVRERMTAVLKNGEAILRGDSFDCTDIRVRPAGG